MSKVADVAFQTVRSLRTRAPQCAKCKRTVDNFGVDRSARFRGYVWFASCHGENTQGVLRDVDFEESRLLIPPELFGAPTPEPAS